MNGAAAEAPVVNLSVRLYRLMLALYPQPFRREYGPHMVQVFRDFALQIHHEMGFVGLVSLWALTLLDWLRSVVEQHLEKETLVTKNTLIRLSGWAMVIGGVASALGFIALILGENYSLRFSGLLEAILIAAFFYGPLGVGLGLLGMRARYGEGVGEVGKIALLLGTLGGMVLVLLGDIVQFFTNDLGDNGFGIFMAGLFLTFITLGVYGVLALLKKPQARGNGLAALGALPIVIIAGMVAISRGGGGYRPLGLAPLIIFASLFTIMAGALAVLGYWLQAELPEQITARAEGS